MAPASPGDAYSASPAVTPNLPNKQIEEHLRRDFRKHKRDFSSTGDLHQKRNGFRMRPKMLAALHDALGELLDVGFAL
eukprot:1187744-Prorocentrum_minimum.AAC.5